MRLATIRTAYGTTAARLDGDALVPLEAADVGEVLAAGGEARPREGAVPVPAAQADFAPVVPRPGKVICVGLNYRAHIAETGRQPPQYPTLFAKFAETLTGARDDLVLPSVSEKVDWEVELGVIIGRPAYRATAEQAGAAIAGYTVVNDADIIAYASQVITLRPGDLIATGTPGGVGNARKPPVYLQPGNVMRTFIEGVGECVNRCVAEKTG
jgi:acylpyruvate hydrolase